MRSFVLATLKGWKYTYEHPGEAIDILLKANPEQTRVVQTELIEVYLKDLIWSENTMKTGLGYNEEAQWLQTQQMLLQSGKINKEIDIKAAFTNQFLPPDPIIPTSGYPK